MSTPKQASIYDDLLCRCSLEDAGGLPRTPPLEDSPDVIPVGEQPVADPQGHFTITYPENVAAPVVAELQNLIYVRGKNLAEVPQSGEIFVYWAPQDQRNDPAVWKQNHLLTSEGHGSFHVTAVDPEAIVVATTPFTFLPDASLAGRNVILLGVFATNEHPNPIPSLRRPFDFDTWIAKKGGIGAFVTEIQPPPAQPKAFCTNALFALTNREGIVSFSLRASNLPTGSEVSFHSSQPDIDGNPIVGGPVKVNNNPFVFTVDARVEANFNTRIHFELTLPRGQKPTADNYVGMSASQLPETVGTGPVKPVLLAQYNVQIKSPIS